MALFTDTAQYANDTLRTKKVQDLNSRRDNAAGRPAEDLEALQAQADIKGFNEAQSAYGRTTDKDMLRQPMAQNTIQASTTASQLEEGSAMILSARGTFYLVKLAESYGPGLYAIDELTREASGSNPNARPGELTSPILLDSIELGYTDITSQVPCLDNQKVIYEFGQNFGNVSISGVVLLGPLGNMSYDGVKRLLTFFHKWRVSVAKHPVAVDVAGEGKYVYLTGLRIGQVDPQFHVLPFVMSGTLIDPSNEKSTINSSGKVLNGASLNEPSLFKALTSKPNTSSDTTQQDIDALNGKPERKLFADWDESVAQQEALAAEEAYSIAAFDAEAQTKAAAIEAEINNRPLTPEQKEQFDRTSAKDREELEKLQQEQARLEDIRYTEASNMTEQSKAAADAKHIRDSAGSSKAERKAYDKKYDKSIAESNKSYAMVDAVDRRSSANDARIEMLEQRITHQRRQAINEQNYDPGLD
jgi:hypothetical protein